MKQQSSKILEWVVKNKGGLIVSIIVVAVGLFIINQFIALVFKADLLLHPCELCQQMGNKCTRYIPINFSNFTYP